MENDQLGDVHETEDAILTSSFTIKTKPYNVSLDKVSLVWNKPRSTDRTLVPRIFFIVTRSILST